MNFEAELEFEAQNQDIDTYFEYEAEFHDS
jgi:hypothetical protein